MKYEVKNKAWKSIHALSIKENLFKPRLFR